MNAALVIIVIAALLAKPRIILDLGSGQALSAETPAPQTPPAPSVVVHVLEKADLAVEKEYIGIVEPIQTVVIKPQVAGEILAVHFKEGSLVKEGEALFTLDARQYEANAALRKADLAKAQANHSWAAKYYERLKSADRRSVSAADLEAAQNNVVQGKAAVEQARASLRLAEIDLGRTKIKAPISGRIGRAEFTKGNYVTPDSSSLATIVQVNPIRVAFALPEGLPRTRGGVWLLRQIGVRNIHPPRRWKALSVGRQARLRGQQDGPEDRLDNDAPAIREQIGRPCAGHDGARSHKADRDTCLGHPAAGGGHDWLVRGLCICG